MSVLGAVRDEVGRGTTTVPAIAARTGLAIDVVSAAVDHLVRVGQLPAPLGGGCPMTACGGCPAASGCGLSGRMEF